MTNEEIFNALTVLRAHCISTPRCIDCSLKDFCSQNYNNTSGEKMQPFRWEFNDPKTTFTF